jgi:hypothetical protein
MLYKFLGTKKTAAVSDLEFAGINATSIISKNSVKHQDFIDEFNEKSKKFVLLSLNVIYQNGEELLEIVFSIRHHPKIKYTPKGGRCAISKKYKEFFKLPLTNNSWMRYI